MEAPPLSTAQPTTPTITPSPAAYPDSVASSPRSRKNESWDADPPPQAKLRLMCSYGGHIVPRPHDKTLCYIGGDTRIIVIDRHTSLSDLHHRLSQTLFNNQPFYLKYQLPSEDLDSLITVTSDEDLENMVEEFDRLHNAAALKPGRLRLFLFPRSPQSLLVETASSKPEDWFFNALNGKSSNLSVGVAASDRGFSESSSVTNLLGLDDDFVGKAAELKIEGPKIGGGNAHGSYVINHDMHSVPDSPLLDTTSSFGSASSSPSMANLPPIRVHVEENRKVQQMCIGAVPTQKQEQEEEEVFTAAGTVGGDYRFISDDERSDHGGQRMAQQQKQTNAFDLPCRDSVSSSDASVVANPLYRQRQVINYSEEEVIQIQSGNSRSPSNHVVEQNKQHDELQQLIHPGGGNHYIPSNAVPTMSYYSVYPQHHPVYFVPARPTQPYNLPLHLHPPPPSYRELPQNTPQPMVSGTGTGVYTTAAATSSPKSAQPQYVIQHPSSNYPYEFADQMYYTPLPPHLAAQYQTLKPHPAMPMLAPQQFLADTVHQGSR